MAINKQDYNSQREDEPFTFEILKLGSSIGERKKNGFLKELNFVSFRGAPGKWDIRDWNEDHTKMSKGITLTADELKELGKAIEELAL